MKRSSTIFLKASGCGWRSLILTGSVWMWLTAGSRFCKTAAQLLRRLKEDFFLVGEMLHGDYKVLVNDGMLHSSTNYECYKGLYSSFNSMNLFEIVHSLLRQFGPENWTLYKGLHLLSFVDNHDVTRIASILSNEKHLPLIYALMFGMPGIPCVYYGSEWGAKGNKSEGDQALRPASKRPWKMNYLNSSAVWLRLKRTPMRSITAHSVRWCLPISNVFSNALPTGKGCLWQLMRTASHIRPTLMRAAAWRWI